MSSSFRSSVRNGSHRLKTDHDAPPDRQTAWRSQPRVVAARPGDHPSIHRFLLATLHQPSPVEFQAQLEAPSYEASDRLLVLRGQQIVSHVRLVNHELHFGSLQLAATGLHDLATLPEYRKQGCATALLEAAERTARAEGAQLMLVRTAHPEFFARRGWFVWGRHSFSVAGPREILSVLSALRAAQSSETVPLREPPAPLNIRIWRHVELSALHRLYARNTQQAYGPRLRSPAYWRWLVGRRGHDRIYIAIDGPDRLEPNGELTPIVGYAAMKGDRIVELMTSPSHPEAAEQLLARACGDAMERDSHPVQLEAPPQHPLHALLAQAGGAVHQGAAENGSVYMAKLFDRPDLLNALGPHLMERARIANLPAVTELGLHVGDDKYRLVLTRRDVRLEPARLGRNYLVCQDGQFSQMLLGHLDLPAATESGRLEASTRAALQYASAMFPRLPTWWPPWDDLRA